MHPLADIRYLPHLSISKEKWDACIRNATNGLIYAEAFYLDALADHWDALVMGDYEAVMPLPWRKKWGISYIYQPLLTAQLGVFGAGLNEVLLKSFLYAIPKKFRLVECSLNSGNNALPIEAHIYQRVNYVLNLNSVYDELRKNYRENIRRNIRKSVQYGTSVNRSVEIEKIIELARSFSMEVPAEEWMRVQQLFQNLKEQGRAVCYGIESQKGELLASAVFLFSHKRAYYILVGNHPNGRTLGASHALIDAFIADHAGREIWLDFEGSDLRNLAFFYSSFGAAEEYYPAIRINRLPWFVRWMKK